MNVRFLASQHRADLGDTLDFINTLEHSRRGDLEHLPTLEVALEWLAGRGLFEERGSQASHDVATSARGEATEDAQPSAGGGTLGAGPSAAEGLEAASLAAIRRARSAFRAVVEAVVEHHPPDSDALAEVNRLLAGQPAPALVAVPDGVAIAERPAPDPLEAALARLAEPIVELIEAGQADRLRLCANASCRWVFYDASRGGRRRWCDMAICGNRAKAARHRARRAARSGPSADMVSHG